MSKREPMQAHQENKVAWNEAAQSYRDDLEGSIAFLAQGGRYFCTPELNYLKDLKTWCQTAIHLQCAAGTDSLSLVNLGAHKVIGVDISDKMIELAREKTSRLKMNAEWLCCDVFQLPSSLDGTADLVYTGRGAINWIMDLDAWASVVGRLLKPDGRFYMLEGHPITYLFDMGASTLQIDPEFQGYFSNKAYRVHGWTESYVGNFGKNKNELAVKNERAWAVSDVINSLIGAGMTLVKFEEHPDAYWKEFPNLAEMDLPVNRARKKSLVRAATSAHIGTY